MVRENLALWWRKDSSFLKQERKKERNTFIDKFKDERKRSHLRTSIASEKGKRALPAVIEGMEAQRRDGRPEKNKKGNQERKTPGKIKDLEESTASLRRCQTFAFRGAIIIGQLCVSTVQKRGVKCRANAEEKPGS